MTNENEISLMCCDHVQTAAQIELLSDVSTIRMASSHCTQSSHRRTHAEHHCTGTKALSFKELQTISDFRQIEFAV